MVDIVMTDLAEDRGMKLGFGGTKGGTGKTTIAVHAAAWLASRGRRVLLIDADEQQTAMDWVAAREEARLNDPDLAAPGIIATALLGKAVRVQGSKMAADYDDVVVDVGGRDTDGLRATLLLVDTFIVPVAPRGFEAWAIPNTVKVVEEAMAMRDFKAHIFLNRADPSGPENAEAIGHLRTFEEHGLHYVDAPVGQRKAIAKATAEGLVVSEWGVRKVSDASRKARPDRQAVEEIDRLMETLTEAV
jgi:chromosome partitioning protein